MPAIGTGSGKSSRGESRGRRRVRRAPPPRSSPTVRTTPTQRRMALAQRRQIVSSERAVGQVANRQRRAARPKAPTRQQVRAARAQRKTYVSQGKAVERVANQQRRQARLSAPGRYYASLSRVPVPKLPNVRYIDYKPKKLQAEHAAKLAPVLTVLRQTTRPLHAIAEATDEAVRGHGLKGVEHGLTHGFTHGQKTFSDVLKDAGVKNKTVRAIAGTALDVAGDPTTYVSGGLGHVAESAAAKAATSASKKALKAGLSEGQAKAFAQRAAKQAAKRAPERKGVVLRVAGKEVPGVRRATAQAARPAKAAARPAGRSRVVQHARAVAADVNPNARPAGVSAAQNRAEIQATRTARAKITRGTHEARQTAIGIKGAVGKNDAKVIDALEAGAKGGRAGRAAIAKLEPDLRQAAVQTRSRLRYANRIRKQAGIKGGERKGYVPHHLSEETLKAERKAAKGVGRRVIRPSSSMARKEQRSLAELRQEHPGRYSENLPTLFANRMAEGHTAVARAELNRRIAELGRPLRKGQELHLAENEGVFHIVGSDLREVKGKDIQRAIDKGGTRGRYVVLSRDLAKRATEGASPQLQGPGIVHGLDRATVGFKRLATGTPGFHIRNLVGDTQNAYLGQPAHRLPGNLVRAGRVLKTVSKQEKALRDLKPHEIGKATVKTKRYGRLTYDEVATQLASHGAFRSGYLARELPELAQSGAKTGIRRLKPRVPQSVKTAALNREDLPRLATAMHALQRGATWEQAAQRVADLHFDYAHLTSFERNIARRFFPFYTFTARDVPLQARSLITRPGKYANFEKVREEAAKASDVQQQNKRTRDLYAQLRAAGVKLPSGWEKALTEWEQRNAGVPLKLGGRNFTLSMSLPLVDLNEFPGAAKGQQLDEYLNKLASLANPLLKDPLELYANYSAYFRDQIQRDNSPLVAAPSFVAAWPAAVRRKLGVVRGTDKKSGRKVWMWPGRVDYVSKNMVPGLGNQAQQLLTQGSDRRGRGGVSKAAGVAGVKSVPVDPVANAVNLAYARQHEIELRLAALHQQGVNKDHRTAEYNRLTKQLKLVNQITYAGKSALGYRVLPKAGAPPKSGGGGGSGGWSAGGGSSGGWSAR